jgi:hypothetical protein
VQASESSTVAGWRVSAGGMDSLQCGPRTRAELRLTSAGDAGVPGRVAWDVATSISDVQLMQTYS